MKRRVLGGLLALVFLMTWGSVQEIQAGVTSKEIAKEFALSVAGLAGDEGDHFTRYGLYTGLGNGGYNAFFGYAAGTNNGANLEGGTMGIDNTFVGDMAGYTEIDANDNTFIGYSAGYAETTGSSNTFVGSQAGMLHHYGHGNVFLGARAGNNCSNGYSNIYLGADVVGITESNTIRIGNPSGPAGQNQTFIAGIVETPFTAEDAPSVVGITSAGRLGTMSGELFPSGPQGPTGPQGPAGEGFVSGALLFLVSTATPPEGFTLVGSTKLSITVAGSRKATSLTVNVYQKQ